MPLPRFSNQFGIVAYSGCSGTESAGHFQIQFFNLFNIARNLGLALRRFALAAQLRDFISQLYEAADCGQEENQSRYELPQVLGDP